MRSKKVKSWYFYKSRNKRREDAILLKNKIANNRILYGTHYYDDTDHTSVYNEIRVWSDALFVSKRFPDMLYNAYISTAQFEFSENIFTKSTTDAYDVLSEEERTDEYENGTEFKPCKFDAWGKPLLYQLEIRNKTYPQCNNKSVLDYSKELHEKYWKDPDDACTDVHIKCTCHTNYRYGIGIHMTVDRPYLDIVSINDIIDQFLEKHEMYCIEKLRTISPEQYRYKDHSFVIFDDGVVDKSHLVFDKTWYAKCIYQYGSIDRIALLLASDVVQWNHAHADVTMDVAVQHVLDTCNTDIRDDISKDVLSSKLLSAAQSQLKDMGV